MHGGEGVLENTIKLMLLINSLLIALIGFAGSAVFLALSKMPEDILNVLGRKFQMSPWFTLTFMFMALGGVLAIITLILEGKIWRLSAMSIQVITIVMLVKISLHLYYIPKSSLILITLILSNTVEMFLTAYRGFSE